MLLSLNNHGTTRKYWYKRKIVENLHKKQRQQGKQAEQMQKVVARPVKNQLPFSSCGDCLLLWALTRSLNFRIKLYGKWVTRLFMQHEWKERLVNKRMRKSKVLFLLQTKQLWGKINLQFLCLLEGNGQAFKFTHLYPTSSYASWFNSWIISSSESPFVLVPHSFCTAVQPAASLWVLIGGGILLAQWELPLHYVSLLDPARQAQTLHVSCNPHYANELRNYHHRSDGKSSPSRESERGDNGSGGRCWTSWSVSEKQPL